MLGMPQQLPSNARLCDRHGCKDTSLCQNEENKKQILDELGLSLSTLITANLAILKGLPGLQKV